MTAGRALLVVATVNQAHGTVFVTGTDVIGLLEMANVRYRITGSGGAVIASADLTDVEVACAAMFRPIRIQARRTVVR